MTALKRNSYILIFVAVIIIGWFRLGTPLITVLFSYFILSRLSLLGRKWLTIVVFLTLVAIVCTALAYFLDQAIKTLPRVATTAIPLIIQYAKEHGLELPFTDWDSLKSVALDSIRGQLHYIGDFAKSATKHFVFVVIGIVVAMSLYANPALDLHRGAYGIRNNVYSLFAGEVADRFRTLYQAFQTVMGAQLIITTLNTGLTAIFLLLVKMPYTPLLLVITFACGFLPIVGNLISNSIIVGVAFTVSPDRALWALAFLVGLHKLEYFLNSKIIGERIHNPVWLTLIGLIVGERLMGIPGMILAPVILNYLKLEGSQIAAQPDRPADLGGPAAIVPFAGEPKAKG